MFGTWKDAVRCGSEVEGGVGIRQGVDLRGVSDEETFERINPRNARERVEELFREPEARVHDPVGFRGAIDR